jgi:hypothetical protein
MSSSDKHSSYNKTEKENNSSLPFSIVTLVLTVFFAALIPASFFLGINIIAAGFLSAFSLAGTITFACLSYSGFLNATRTTTIENDESKDGPTRNASSDANDRLRKSDHELNRANEAAVPSEDGKEDATAHDRDEANEDLSKIPVKKAPSKK